VNALRDELDFVRRRAERAAAQLDREAQAKEALARADLRVMVRYEELYPAERAGAATIAGRPVAGGLRWGRSCRR
jgi:hypothetical protein